MYGLGTGGGSGNQAEKILVKKISISTNYKKIAAGKKIRLAADVTPANAGNRTVKWKSGNPKAATVNSKGQVTAKKAGIGKTVTITATAVDGSGKKASVKLKIVKHAVKKITLTCGGKQIRAGKKISVKAGRKVVLKAKVSVTGKTANKKLAWSSSNPKYATVNAKGEVKTKKSAKGKKVTITASSTDGANKKASVTIKIN